ncbi:hypothetical protein Cadr_000010161 [Camelus dromedarius]|uniref:Uncharacterized protein n=1 Tax=Camelus dromedarius TaxID=9838 RepID=A0A5N4DWK3_CAMDR|nr:hypothetical protein Cadr_000010161 [Camelus dromedarius]
MVVESEGEEDPWAVEAMEVVAVVVVAEEDSPVVVVAVEDSGKLGTGSVLILRAEEAMIGAATEAEEGTVEASEGAGVVGTEVALALARWTPGADPDDVSLA